MIPLLTKKNYIGKVLSIGGDSLIGYWPLWEASGTNADDRSGNDHDGEYTGVTLADEPGIGDGRRAPLFDGANDYVDVYSAGLASAFDGSEGSIVFWAKVEVSSVWEDGSNHTPITFLVDGSNYVRIRKRTTNNTLTWEYVAGGNAKTITSTSSSTAWLPLGITWSASGDAVKGYLDGSEVGSESSLGTWSGSPSSTRSVIGATSNTPAEPWQGYIAHAQLYDAALTATQISNLSRV